MHGITKIVIFSELGICNAGYVHTSNLLKLSSLVYEINMDFNLISFSVTCV